MGGTNPVQIIYNPAKKVVDETLDHTKKALDKVTGAGDARKQAQAQFEAQQARQDRLEADAKARAAKEESSANMIRERDQARARQRSLAQGSGGRRDTILTGPLGLPGDPSQRAGKTLLGT